MRISGYSGWSASCVIPAGNEEKNHACVDMISAGNEENGHACMDI